MATRENIIDLAEELIRTKGYNAFSYADIARTLNIRNAAIHYHFPVKADLGVSVVERELQKIEEGRMQWAHLPGKEELQKVAGTFYGSSRKGRICLNGSLTPDYLTLPPSLQQKVAAMCQASVEWMTGCLEKGRKDGSLQFQGAAEDRALLVISALLSSLLLSRVMGAEIFDRMLNQLLKDLEQ